MSLITVAEFQQPEHALVLASALDAAGIPAIVPERHMHSYFPYLSLGFTAARVMVPAALEADAHAIANMEQPREPFIACPQCKGQSRKLKTRGGPFVLGLAALYPLAIGTWALAVPPRVVSRRICEACGHRFKPPRPDPISTDEAGYEPAKRPTA